MKKTKVRCWKTDNPLYIKYHDEEWGVPLHDDNKLFEFLTLDGFQAGLTWELILKRREGLRKAFDNFDPKEIEKYGEKDIQRLMNNPDVIKNKAKILASISNARIFHEVQKDFGSFDAFIWQFVDGKTVDHTLKSYSDLPPDSEESKAMSKELKKRGFKFVGPTICYAFMQAAGLVNDHLTFCFRYDQIRKMTRRNMKHRNV